MFSLEKFLITLVTAFIDLDFGAKFPGLHPNDRQTKYHEMK